MSRKLWVILGVLVLVGLTTTIVFAGRMRYKAPSVDTTGGTGGSLSSVPSVGARGPGTVTINNFKTLFGHGDLTGLGNLDVEVKLTATAQTVGNITCTNHGQQLVEAQPRQFTVVSVQFVPSQNFTKNGTTSFNVPTGDFEPQLSSGQFCPNDNWSALIDGLVWKGLATLTATQPDGQVVTAKFNCDQSAPGVDVVCQRLN